MNKKYHVIWALLAAFVLFYSGTFRTISTNAPWLPQTLQKQISNKSQPVLKSSGLLVKAAKPKRPSLLRKAKKPERKVVIILAYMHTGSSFLGEILQNHEHTFFEYENLRSLMYSTRAAKMIYFLNGTKIRLQQNTDVKVLHHNVDPLIGSEAVLKMTSCKHQELDIATLANHYFTYDSPVNRDLRPFFVCQEKQYGRKTSLHPFSALRYVENSMLRNVTRAKNILRKCLPLLTEKCEKAQIVVEKFIRMTMKMAKNLLENISDLKIIHLFRDPRAMLDSQVRKKDSGAQVLSVFNGRAQYMCEQMAKDHNLAKDLKEQYPGQIYTLRYEDMVDTPIKTAQQIFDFIDVPFTNSDKSYVEKYSRPAVAVNGSVPLSSWRKNIKPQFLDVVDRFCASLYKEFGYLKFKEYRDIKDSRQKDHVQRSSTKL